MNEKVTLQNLIDIFTKENRISKEKGDFFVKAFFELIKEGLERDKIVKIKGFGTFKVLDMEPRESVNVNTGERFQIAGHSKVSFIPDATLKEMVNRPFAGFETVILNNGVMFDEKLKSEDAKEESVESNEAVEKDVESSNQQTEETLSEQAEPIVEQQLEQTSEITEKEQAEHEPVQEERESVIAASDEPEQSLSEQHSSEQEKKDVPAPQNTVDETPSKQVEAIISKEIESTPLKPLVEERRIDKTPKNKKKRRKRNFVNPSMVMGAFTVLVLVVFGGIVYWMLTPEKAVTSKPFDQQTSAPTDINDSAKDVYPEDTMSMAEKALILAQQSGGSDAMDDTTRQRAAMLLTKTRKDEAKKKIPEAKVSETKAQVNMPIKAGAKHQEESKIKASGNIVITGLKTIHVMAEGENLYTISKKYLGSKDKIKYLLQYNNFKNPDLVTIGTKIRIPKLSE